MHSNPPPRHAKTVARRRSGTLLHARVHCPRQRKHQPLKAFLRGRQHSTAQNKPFWHDAAPSSRNHLGVLNSLVGRGCIPALASPSDLVSECKAKSRVCVLHCATMGNTTIHNSCLGCIYDFNSLHQPHHAKGDCEAQFANHGLSCEHAGGGTYPP